MREFNSEVQQDIVFAPLGRDVYRMRDRQGLLLAPAERNLKSISRTIAGNIALRWSATYRVHRLIYKHLAPMERNEWHCCIWKLRSPWTNGSLPELGAVEAGAHATQISTGKLSRGLHGGQHAF
jgi:hypothetical protein